VVWWSLVAVALGGPETGAAASPVDLVRQAALGARAGLKSGEGSGVYRQYDPQGALIGDVAFELRFRGQCYHLNLHFRRAITDESRLPRRLIVGDPSAVFFRDYEHDLGRGSPVVVPPSGYRGATAGFQVALQSVTAGVGRMAHFASQRVSVERLPNGRLRGRIRWTDRFQETFEAAPEAGYNVVTLESFLDEVRHGELVRLEWAQDAGAWYVRKGSIQRWLWGKADIRYEWEYHRFRANPALSDELFSMAALSLKAGDRIIDQRPGPLKTYQVDPGAVRENKLDTMAAQLEQMPVRGAMIAPPPASHRLAWTLAIGVGVAAAAALAWLANARLQHRASSQDQAV
jgi:hypothetical protein